LHKYVFPGFYLYAGRVIKVMKEVITIDGPSGSGKSTISKLLAKRLGYKYLDTGALYRAVAWKVKEEDAEIEDEEAINKVLNNIDINLTDKKIFVNGMDVTALIRTAEIGELSSRVSARPAVREYLFSIQREAGMRGKVVIEGRDTGTAIFPEAVNKFFLDASIEERARRRSNDLKTDDDGITIEETIRDLKKRDTRDSTRESSPLKKTGDMVCIDSTSLTIDEVINEIMLELKRTSED
jgi:cytidylate kinase